MQKMTHNFLQEQTLNKTKCITMYGIKHRANVRRDFAVWRASEMSNFP